MEKKAYIEKLEAELKEWSARIGDLAAKAEQMKEEKKREYREQLEMLRAKQEAAGKKLHDLKEASGKAWEDMKSGVDRAWDELRAALHKAGEQFKKAQQK